MLQAGTTLPIAPLLALIALVGLGLGCDSRDAPAPTAILEPVAPEFIYVGMRDNDAPFIDYEGDGVVVEGATRRPHESGPFAVELVAIDLDPTRETWVAGDPVDDRLVLRLQADITRGSEDGFRMSGALETRRPVRLQFVQMNAKGDGSGEAFPELAFTPGRHDLSFEGTVVGWLAP